MDVFKNIFQNLAKSKKIFYENGSISFEELFSNASRMPLKKPQNNWIYLSNTENPLSLLSTILACIFENKNIIIFKSDDAVFKKEKPNPQTNLNEYNGKKHLREVKYNDILIGIQSSGATGEQKTIIHRLSNLLESARTVNKGLSIRENNIYHICLPLNHIAGLAILFRSMVGSFSIRKTTKDELKKGDLRGVISLVSAQVPLILANNYIVPNHLKLFIGGGKPNPDYLKRCIEKGFPLYTSYGSSETASTFAMRKHLSSKNLNSSGRPFKGSSAKVIDKILYIKSPYLFTGLLIENQILPPATSNGYFKTNDQAEIKEGEIFILGRSDQVIVTGGKNISLESIRTQISNEINNDQFYLVSHNHEKWGESYSVIFESTEKINEHAITISLNKILKNEYKPSKIEFISENHHFDGIKPSKNELLKIIKEKSY